MLNVSVSTLPARLHPYPLLVGSYITEGVVVDKSVISFICSIDPENQVIVTCFATLSNEYDRCVYVCII